MGDLELPPELRDRYSVVRTLGSGAFGVVRAVHDRELDRTLALKQVVSHFQEDENALARFLRECQILSTLEHPHLLRFFGAGVSDGKPWLLTELLEGRGLNTAPVPEDPVEKILELGSALEVIHAAGVVHRDVKLENAFLTTHGRTVLLDLGLARESASGFTATGVVVGTPAYFAPEVLKGAPASPASDWFALGVMLYQLLEGSIPYDLGDLFLAEADKPLPRPELSHTWSGGPEERLVLALLHTDPSRRPTTVVAARAKLDPGPARSGDTHVRVAALPAHKSASLPRVLSATEPRPTSNSPRSRAPYVASVLGIAACLALSIWGLSASPGAPSEPQKEDALQAIAPLPSPELLKRAKRFLVFAKFGTTPAAREIRTGRCLLELGDAAMPQRWRGYLHALRNWLIQLSEGAETDVAFERRLLSEENEAHFRLLARAIPSEVAARADYALVDAMNPLFVPATSGPRAEGEALLKSKTSHFVAVYQQVRDSSTEWFEHLPPSLRERRLIRMLRWDWQKDFPIIDLEQAHQDLFGEMLPALEETSVGDLVLVSAIHLLGTKQLREFKTCGERDQMLSEITQGLIRYQARLDSHDKRFWNHLFGSATVHFKRCPPEASDASGPLISALEQASRLYRRSYLEFLSRSRRENAPWYQPPKIPVR